MSESDNDDNNKNDSETKKLNEQIAERSYALTLSLQTLTKLAELCGQTVNSWDIDLICVSASKASEGSSRAAALELLSEMAKIKPEMVVKKVVDVATTLSRIAGENDDGGLVDTGRGPVLPTGQPFRDFFEPAERPRRLGQGRFAGFGLSDGGIAGGWNQSQPGQDSVNAVGCVRHDARTI